MPAIQYAPMYIVRFEGTLTQGPNAGKTFTFATSWGGTFRDTLEEARVLRDDYLGKEPGLRYQICFHQFQKVGRKGKMVDLVIE